LFAAEIAGRLFGGGFAVCANLEILVSANVPSPRWQVAFDKEEGFVKHIFGKEILGGAQAPRKRPKSGRVL
jgi:hypothetical protein